jgi:hypothetical protein
LKEEAVMRKKSDFYISKINHRHNTGPIGSLSLVGRSGRSFSGYDASVLKSGIQKYARRNEVSKGLWCLVDMDSFSLLEKDGVALDAYLTANSKKVRKKVKTHAKRLRTNMVNRLVVMMSEEVSISAWWMPLKIYELYQNWIDNRDNNDSRKYLVDMYLYLTSQKMIRLISDLKSVYTLPPYYVKSRQMNDFRQIHRGIRTVLPRCIRQPNERRGM